MDKGVLRVEVYWGIEMRNRIAPERQEGSQVGCHQGNLSESVL